MNPALIVMAILGCADDGNQCQSVQKVATPYESVEACNKAAPRVLENLTDLAYPTVMAQCQRETRPAVADATKRAGS